MIIKKYPLLSSSLNIKLIYLNTVYLNTYLNKYNSKLINLSHHDIHKHILNINNTY